MLVLVIEHDTLDAPQHVFEFEMKLRMSRKPFLEIRSQVGFPQPVFGVIEKLNRYG